jgi:hypothetical protein
MLKEMKRKAEAAGNLKPQPALETIKAIIHSPASKEQVKTTAAPPIYVYCT